MLNILVVEDDDTLLRVMCAVLIREGFHALPARNGKEALSIMEASHTDLCVMDIMMSEMDGFELIKTLRGCGYSFPILMVTAKERFEDKEKAFSLGADDYMVKPIDVKEMILRVEALLRRAKLSVDRRLVIGSTALDYDSMTVRTGETETLLPQKEFMLLFRLLSYPGKIFTRQTLIDELWGLASNSEQRTVDVHINRLREKFGGCADFEIVTVRGLGYKAVKTA